jgi:hypothetical protein
VGCRTRGLSANWLKAQREVIFEPHRSALGRTWRVSASSCGSSAGLWGSLGADRRIGREFSSSSPRRQHKLGSMVIA